MSEAARWAPRFAPGHAGCVLDIAQEHGFVRESTLGSCTEFDVVDAVEALRWLAERGLFDESGIVVPGSEHIGGAWE
jgi:hypothetical protein